MYMCILAVTLCTAMQQQVLGYRICHYYVYVYVYVDKKVKEKRDVIIRMEVRIDRDRMNACLVGKIQNYVCEKKVRLEGVNII